MDNDHAKLRLIYTFFLLCASYIYLENYVIS